MKLPWKRSVLSLFTLPNFSKQAACFWLFLIFVSVDQDLNNNSDFGSVGDFDIDNISLSEVLDFSIDTTPLDLSYLSSFEKSCKTMSTPQIQNKIKNNNVKKGLVRAFFLLVVGKRPNIFILPSYIYYICTCLFPNRF